MRFTVLAVGKLKKGPLTDLAQDYTRMLRGHLILEELDIKAQPNTDLQIQKEGEELLKRLPDSAYVIALDERGRSLSSRDLSNQMETLKHRTSEIYFIIGGADGLSEPVRKRADLILSFGKATWPHQLVRVMLLEQLYRARQIALGHPYHRD